ncbi:augmin subunit 6, GEMINI POLLEN 3 [Hibiscus trionum]|uniref:Augmin subunit 6, GEMINI POLLEN 3 n=2 Tax=Hibiscus trionum TaxID=183268 RepID=A0A9W7IYL7_HIBTR|nr:augmin subunit 6, GEMINI POLLEN 3 [Hibiscus trionum]
MTMDREKEREVELESAMYTNCLLLGLDPSIIGLGASNGTPRVGLFRHSNPKLGEQLLYFILSSLRGPAQSARDFDRVWPIFDSAQSRDFRKVVQGIITELEAQGALPRSNSRVSSLATCCGPRFVELLWQLSLHALREVHRRNFAADVASNPLPAPLTDVAFSHAASLLPVTKARIALERRRFLKNAETSVQRQAMWSNLAHEMTAEFRGLCAEEAYLQQELEKLHDLRNKVKLEGELWDDLVSTSSQNSHLVSKATRLWESILSRKNEHEVLASGPIEDLIAHREHRYRISGSSLLSAMDRSSQVPPTEVLSGQSGDLDGKEQNDGYHTQFNEETLSRVDDRSGRIHQTVDVAEVIRRWTHALQRIHKQSLQLAKANDGEGPDILRSAHDGGTSGHAESLAATLAEHQQHLASFQVLINQLKEVAPSIEKSISECTEKVNSISSNLPPMAKHRGQASSPNQAQSSGRTLESSSDDVGDITSKMSAVQLEKISASPPALKLPQLFSLTPNSSGKGGTMQKRAPLTPNSAGKGGNMQKRHTFAPETNQIGTFSEKNSVEQPLVNNHVDYPPQDTDGSYIQNLKRSVRQAALSTPSSNSESLLDSQSNESSEHFFVPVSSTNFSLGGPENKVGSIRTKKVFSTRTDNSVLDSHASNGHVVSDNYDDLPQMFNNLDSLNDYDQANGFLSAGASSSAASDGQSFFDVDEAQDQVFSPPLLMETSLFADAYEDLLAPLSETETALMEH